MKSNILESKKKLNQDLVNSLCESYRISFGPCPLLQTRQRQNLIPRQCLSFILKNKFNTTYKQVGRYLGIDHSTVIHAEKQVKNRMSILDKEFVTTVNNWAVIFEKVMPDDVRTMWSTQDRIIAVLETTLLNTDSSISVLEAVLEKYREDVVK